MSEWNKYQRLGQIEARPWTKREADEYHLHNNSGGISVSDADFGHAISKDTVGFVARNPDNHADQWYIAPDYFAKHYAVPVSARPPTHGEWVEAAKYEAVTSALSISKAAAEARIAELTTLVERYASECAECDGTGDGRTVHSVQGGEIVETTLACQDCADIRATLRSPDTGSAK